MRASSWRRSGRFPLPVEVVRFGVPATRRLVEAIAAQAGCEGEIRLRRDRSGEPFVTDQGNLILDCAFGRIPEPEVLAFALKRVPGVVEHGLFLGIADVAILAGERRACKCCSRRGEDLTDAVACSRELRWRMASTMICS